MDTLRTNPRDPESRWPMRVRALRARQQCVLHNVVVVRFVEVHDEESGRCAKTGAGYHIARPVLIRLDARETDTGCQGVREWRYPFDRMRPPVRRLGAQDGSDGECGVGMAGWERRMGRGSESTTPAEVVALVEIHERSLAPGNAFDEGSRQEAESDRLRRVKSDRRDVAVMRKPSHAERAEREYRRGGIANRVEYARTGP